MENCQHRENIERNWLCDSKNIEENIVLGHTGRLFFECKLIVLINQNGLLAKSINKMIFEMQFTFCTDTLVKRCVWSLKLFRE